MGPFTQRALTEADTQAYIALTDAICDADDSDDRVDEQAYRFMLNYPLSVPELEDFQGVFDGERLVASGWASRRSEASPVHWMSSGGGVHPEYRGGGIGTLLIKWQQELARVVHERYFPGQPLELSARATESNIGARELLENEGYELQRWFFSMKRPESAPVPEAEAPDGLKFEPYTEAVREPLRLVHNEAFRDHWRFTANTREIWESLMSLAGSFRPELSFLLRDAANGEIAGYLLSTVNESEFKATGVRDIHFSRIGTTREYRRRGVATALIAHAVAESRRLGYRTASLNVDAESPTGALGVYERSGFASERAVMTYTKALTA